jgi:hypothetical protein
VFLSDFKQTFGKKAFPGLFRWNKYCEGFFTFFQATAGGVWD